MSLQLELPVRDLPADDRYHASRSPELVRVPELTFAMVDGTGHPTASDEFAAAIQALYGISYTLRFGLKRERGLVYRVGPLEGLWWADDMAEFRRAERDHWRWTAMIVQPDVVTDDLFEHARADVIRKRGASAALERARLERFDEGLAGQVLYLGPYSEEGPTIDGLHAFIHGLGLSFDGLRERHHEIYLGDPRRSAPEKLRTIVRQPVNDRL
jgi:hypothetical protein